jgi:hypothetical protein
MASLGQKEGVHGSLDRVRAVPFEALELPLVGLWA